MTPGSRFVLGAVFVLLGWVIFGLAVREFGWQPGVVLIGDGAMYVIVSAFIWLAFKMNARSSAPGEPKTQDGDLPHSGWARLFSERVVIARLYASVGRSSRTAGLGFGALSIALLILSVYNGFIVFEIDSIIAFLAAIVL